jgi:hypothetical protein
MAYTTGQTLAQIITAVQAATGNSVNNPAADAITNAMSGLATALPPYPPVNSPILFAGVLIKCTTSNVANTPVFAYDATPA